MIVVDLGYNFKYSKVPSIYLFTYIDAILGSAVYLVDFSDLCGDPYSASFTA